MGEQIPEEFIVVEGRDDTRRLVEVFGSRIKTIETHGSAIDQTVLDEIGQALKRSDVIVFTDPDYPGQRIRHIIQAHYPTIKHAHLSQSEAQSRRAGMSLGVEHASDEVIRQALSSVMTPAIIRENDRYIPVAQLMELGLIGHPEAQWYRDYISDYYRIGKMNGKQLRKQLAAYHITLEQLEDVLEEGRRLGRR